MEGRTARAVIGAGYGDEGKGLMTDWLADKGADVVVRASSGAQAGHTVMKADGTRHVFHHFGSGSLAGVRTHLARRFALHPMLFASEREELATKGADVRLTADPGAQVTLPYDVMLNQFIETRRGASRHGSCGVGFGETVERSSRQDLSLTFQTLHRAEDIRPLLRRVREEWVPARLAALGGGQMTEEERALVSDDRILERFVLDCEAFADAVGLMDDSRLGGAVLFEGAQGLMLDQDYGAFPHVTRSNTGIVNMAEVAALAGIERIDAMYVTRAYVTRHGAGPLTHEGELEGVEVVDPTNVPNGWQGSMRTAPLDLGILSAATAHDAARANGAVDLRATLAVTCLDQVRGLAPVRGARRPALSAMDIARAAASACRFALEAVSFGPARSEVFRSREA